MRIVSFCFFYNTGRNNPPKTRQNGVGETFFSPFSFIGKCVYAIGEKLKEFGLASQNFAK